MSRTEWLERRQKSLGASDVAAVLGLSKWSTEYDVYASKVYPLQEDNGSQATYLGHALQPVIGAEAAKHSELTLVSEEEFAVHPVDTWASATLDYRATDRSGEFVILECKATRDNYWTEIPEYYKTQLAWQCFVHGIRHAKLAALHASTKLEVYDFDFKADAPWFDHVLTICRHWWFDHVDAKVAPELSAGAMIRRGLLQASIGKTVELSDAVFDAVQELSRLKAENASLVDQITEAEDFIKASLGDAETGLYRGEKLVTWKEVRPKPKFDVDAFKASDPERYAANLKDSKPYRRFLINAPKGK